MSAPGIGLARFPVAVTVGLPMWFGFHPTDSGLLVHIAGSDISGVEIMRFSDSGAITIATRFLRTGNGAASANVVDTQVPIVQAGNYSTIRIDASAAPGGGHSTVYTVQKNGVDTPITVTLGAAQTTNTATLASVSWAAGDFMSIKQVPDGAGNATADPRVTVS